MGACVSSACEGGHGSSSPTTMTTTKTILISEDGKLLELAGAVRAAQALSDANSSGCSSSSHFICDADDIELDGGVAALGAEEVLRPGQLYFLLPRSMLMRRLLPEEIAALAVRASAALLECGSSVAFGMPAGRDGWEEGGRRVAPMGGFTVGTAAVERRRRPRGKTSGKGRNYSPRLVAIEE